jgi:hypothetical protein
MKNNKQPYQSNLVWEPSPEINWIDKVYPVKDGINLPNSIEEDVGGFSLCPHYSKKQLRKINRVSLKRDKKCVRPVIHVYGTKPKEISEAAVKAYERVRNELIQEGYTIAPLNSKSGKERSIVRDDYRNN